MNKILLCLCLFFISCSNSDDSEASELEGSWTGSIINETYPQNEYTFTFTNDNFEINGIINDGEDIPVIGSGTFTTNTQVEPHEIDITIISYEIGGDALTDYYGLTSLCIYQIDGDNLKFAGAEPGALERPTNFTGNEEGMQVYLLVRD